MLKENILYSGDLTEMERAVNDMVIPQSRGPEIVELRILGFPHGYETYLCSVIISLQVRRQVRHLMALTRTLLQLIMYAFIQKHTFVKHGIPDASGLFLLLRYIVMNVLYIIMTGEAVSLQEKLQELGFVYKLWTEDLPETATKRLVENY